jgi:hypothetical protein
MPSIALAMGGGNGAGSGERQDIGEGARADQIQQLGATVQNYTRSSKAKSKASALNVA